MEQKTETPAFDISVKSVAKYALLPGILPRLQRMAMHFSQFMFMFTQVFGAVGLIDRNHPCLRPENIGRYRFIDILGLAASNVVFDKKHIPQIVMFFVVVLSIVLTAAIIVGLIASTVFGIHEAHAQFFGKPPSSPYGYDVQYDWSLKFLYRIFGDTGFFPKPPTGEAQGNAWFSLILIGMLKYYSMAMLIIAAFMVMYILLITLTEAARTGEPFGSRFDGIWAPIRLALSIGLLMPISGGGYNGAQLITFQAAVWGSNLATNVWYGGVDAVAKSTNSPKFFSSSMSDPGYKFVRDIFLVNLCVDAMNKVPESESWKAGKVVWNASVTKDKINYTFGPEESPDFCGQVSVLRMPDPSVTKPENLSGTSWPDMTTAAYQQIAKLFLPIPADRQLTGADNSKLSDHGDAVVQETMAPVVNAATTGVFLETMGGDNSDTYFKDIISKQFPGGQAVRGWMVKYWEPLGTTVTVDNKKSDFFSTPTYTNVINNYNTWLISSLVQDAKYGWTTAGVFYLRMSSAMATISRIVNDPPTVTMLPSNLSKAFSTPDNPSANTDQVREYCSGTFSKFWNVHFGDGMCTKYDAAKNLNQYFQGGKSWFHDSVQGDAPIYTMMGGLSFDRTLDLGEPETSSNLHAGLILGPIMDKLGEMAKIDNNSLNPLGTVINWGNNMLIIAMIAGAIGLVGTSSGITSMAFTLGGLLLLPGFILAFWVPTIPFMHFTFAVLEWMISIMEAVIGMPLWALSLITLEGDGLGQQGMAGVKRLFEIVMRPTIIVISLIVSVIIFSAGVSFFNDAMALYSSASADANSGQGWAQASVSGLGMVFIYMFGIYTLATSCFKLIDKIPDGFGRWMGLEQGFGSKIKTGMSTLNSLILGGAAINGLQSLGNSAKSGRDKVRADRAKKRAEKEKKNS